MAMLEPQGSSFEEEGYNYSNPDDTEESISSSSSGSDNSSTAESHSTTRSGSRTTSQSRSYRSDDDHDPSSRPSSESDEDSSSYTSHEEGLYSNSNKEDRHNQQYNDSQSVYEDDVSTLHDDSPGAESSSIAMVGGGDRWKESNTITQKVPEEEEDSLREPESMDGLQTHDDFESEDDDDDDLRTGDDDDESTEEEEDSQAQDDDESMGDSHTHESSYLDDSRAEQDSRRTHDESSSYVEDDSRTHGEAYILDDSRAHIEESYLDHSGTTQDESHLQEDSHESSFTGVEQQGSSGSFTGAQQGSSGSTTLDDSHAESSTIDDEETNGDEFAYYPRPSTIEEGSREESSTLGDGSTVDDDDDSSFPREARRAPSNFEQYEGVDETSGNNVTAREVAPVVVAAASVAPVMATTSVAGTSEVPVVMSSIANEISGSESGSEFSGSTESSSGSASGSEASRSTESGSGSESSGSSSSGSSSSGSSSSGSSSSGSSSSGSSSSKSVQNVPASVSAVSRSSRDLTPVDAPDGASSETSSVSGSSSSSSSSSSTDYSVSSSGSSTSVSQREGSPSGPAADRAAGAGTVVLAGANAAALAHTERTEAQPDHSFTEAYPVEDDVSSSSSSSGSSSSTSESGSGSSSSTSESSSGSSSSTSKSSGESDDSSYSPLPALATNESIPLKTPDYVPDGSWQDGRPVPSPPPRRQMPLALDSSMTQEMSKQPLVSGSDQMNSSQERQSLGRALSGVPLRQVQSPTTTVSSLSASQITSEYRKAVEKEEPLHATEDNDRLGLQDERPRKKRRRKKGKQGRCHEGLTKLEHHVQDALSALSGEESRKGVRALVAMDGNKESVTATESISMAPHTAHNLLYGFEALLAALLQVSDEMELLAIFNNAASTVISTDALNAILSHAPALDHVFLALRPILQQFLEEQADQEMDSLLSRADKLVRLLCEVTYRVCKRQEWNARSKTVFVTLMELLERVTIAITCLFENQSVPEYKMSLQLRRAWSATGHVEEMKTIYKTSDTWLLQQVCYEVIVSTDQWCPNIKDLADACEVGQSATDSSSISPSPDTRFARVPPLAAQVLDKINGDPLPRTAPLASILRRILPPYALTDKAVLSTFSGLRSTVRKPPGVTGAVNMVAISSVPEGIDDPDACGMRGVGKTTMAAMVASHTDVRRFFKDGIAWVHVGAKEMNYMRYTQLLRELVSQLEFFDGVPLFAELLHTPGEPRSRRKRREAGFMIYARVTVTELLQNRNVLIILDDVYFDTDLEWFSFAPSTSVPSIRTGQGTATLLITSRCRDLLLPADTVEIDLLDESDAIRLLLTESGLTTDFVIAESKEARSVVRECANHPLAVKSVGRWLSLKHASAGVISSVEEIHEDVAESIDKILKSGDLQGANMMYEIMSMSFSPAVNGEPTNVIKLCFASFVTVFCNEEYHSDFMSEVSPPMIPASIAEILFETLLELEEESLFQEGSLFYSQRREATMLIPEALSKLGVLKVISTYDGDTDGEASIESSKQSLEGQRFLQIMHYIQQEYGEYLSKEEEGMRTLTQDAERRWNRAFVTAYLNRTADWDSELPDASRDYAIDMIVSHMLRAEMYDEAASLLANETFVTGRILVLGRENATRRHIVDCETLFAKLSEQNDRERSELNPKSVMRHAYQALGAQLNPKNTEYDIEERRVASIEVGRAHYEIGFSLAEKRCWQAAIAHWESSQELLLSSLGMVEFVAAIQYNVGVVYAEMNEYEQGLASLKQCLRIRGAIHGEEHILYAQTIQKIGDVFLGMSDYAEATDSYNWALDVMYVEPSHHRVDIGDILDNMGNIHYSMGEVSEALRCYEDALRSKKQELGDDHHELAATYQHIGNCLSDQGETEEAIEHFQEAIRLRELDPDGEAERDADILSIEGVLSNLTGRQEEGLHFYENALDIMATKAPHKKEKIAALLHLIGCVYLMNGEHKKAMKLFQESLQTRRKVLGFVHLDVASTLFNIAFLHQTRHRLDKALKCLEEALKIRQLRLPDSEKVAITHEKIGTLAKALGKSKKAEESFEEALRIRQQLHGESHEAVASVLHEMGDLMDDLGEYDDAMKYYVDALDIRRRRLGPDHEDVAATLYSMGFTLHHLESTERALQCFEESLNIRKRRLGEDSKEVGDTLNTMGYLQAKRGELDDALNLLWAALRIRKLHEDQSNSIKCSETLKNIGNVHREKQEHELAVECYEECLRIRRTELGDDHEKVADALIAIGNVRNDMEMTEDAMRAYEEALKIRTHKWGENDQRVAVVLQYMGTMEFRAGDLDTARELLEDYIRIRREGEIPFDGDYVNVLFMIGNINKMRGDDVLARECWSEAYEVFQELGLADENPQIAKVMNNLLYADISNNSTASSSSEDEEKKRPGLLSHLSNRFKDSLRAEKMPKLSSSS